MATTVTLTAAQLQAKADAAFLHQLGYTYNNPKYQQEAARLLKRAGVK